MLRTCALARSACSASLRIFKAPRLSVPLPLPLPLRPACPNPSPALFGALLRGLTTALPPVLCAPSSAGPGLAAARVLARGLSTASQGPTKKTPQLAKVKKVEELLQSPTGDRRWTIAVVGRPNVGKSTLFNRLVGRFEAIVDPTPGVTRDRREGEGSLVDLEFTVVDTAGLEEHSSFLTKLRDLQLQDRNSRRALDAEEESNRTHHDTPLTPELKQGMLAQTEQALMGADLALFMIDAREGVTQADEVFASWIRKRIAAEKRMTSEALTEHRKRKGHAPWVPVLLVANKCETESLRYQDGLLEAYSLGFGDPVAISAEHGDGLGELYQAIRETMNHITELEAPPDSPDSMDPKPLNQPKQEDSATSAPHAAKAKRGRAGRAAKDAGSEEGAKKATEEAEGSTLQLAIVGKPNVGKSTLINALLGSERVLTGPQPGVTRDAITVNWLTYRAPRTGHAKDQAEDAEGQSEGAEDGAKPDEQLLHFQLVDTAGLKGVGPVQLAKFSRVDAMAMRASLKAIEYANVVGLVLDASDNLDQLAQIVIESRKVLEAAEQARDYERDSEHRAKRKERDGAPSKQDKDTRAPSPDEVEQARLAVQNVVSHSDLAIARFVIKQGKALVLIANKWDKINPEKRVTTLFGLQQLFSTVLANAKGVPILPICATESKGLKKLVPLVVQQYNRWDLRISTSRLNAWLRELMRFRPPPNVQGRPINLKYITQVTVRPPTFVVFCSRAAAVPETYVSSLTNALRQEFDLEGIPIRLFLRQRDNPYTLADSVSALRASVRRAKRPAQPSQPSQDAGDGGSEPAEEAEFELTEAEHADLLKEMQAPDEHEAPMAFSDAALVRSGLPPIVERPGQGSKRAKQSKGSAESQSSTHKKKGQMPLRKVMEKSKANRTRKQKRQAR